MNTITSIVKRHPLVTFFALAYGISYTSIFYRQSGPTSRFCTHLAR